MVVWPEGTRTASLRSQLPAKFAEDDSDDNMYLLYRYPILNSERYAVGGGSSSPGQTTAGPDSGPAVDPSPPDAQAVPTWMTKSGS